MQTAPTTAATRGVLASLVASILFASIFFLAGSVEATAEVVFAWRVVVTLGCYALMLAHPKARHMLREYWVRLRAHWWTPLLMILLAVLIGFELWLFLWAPLHGYGLDVALGYLLLPITLVLSSWVVLRSPVTRLQWIVFALATVAVGVKTIASAQISWVIFGVCLVYPIYFILRQKHGLDGPPAFGVEVAVLTPLAVVLLATAEDTRGEDIASLALIGFLGAIAMVLYLLASWLLPLPLFGLLSYFEPVLLVVVALMLGEKFAAIDFVAYGILAIALTLLAADGFVRTRRGHSQRTT